METKNFFLINLQVIIAATICDGNIDESEMKKIHSYVEKETISSSVDIKLAAEDQIKLSKQDPVIYCNKILQEINNAPLTLAEKIYITNSAIETVRVDGLMLSEEIKFIKSLIAKMGLTDSMVESLSGKWWIIKDSSEM
jgi:uncharacterized membrane protein YebE (DUF533 family)